jgi:hypothetical protein
MFFNFTLGPAVFVKDIETIKDVKEDLISEGLMVLQVIVNKKHKMFNIEGVAYHEIDAIITTLQYKENYE